MIDNSRFSFFFCQLEPRGVKASGFFGVMKEWKNEEPKGLHPWVLLCIHKVIKKEIFHKEINWELLQVIPRSLANSYYH